MYKLHLVILTDVMESEPNCAFSCDAGLCVQGSTPHQCDIGWLLCWRLLFVDLDRCAGPFRALHRASIPQREQRLALQGPYISTFFYKSKGMSRFTHL